MKLILGGTHGLGWEIAKILRDAGEDVWVAGRSYDEAEHGAGMAVDLSEAADVAKLTEYISNAPALTGFYWLAGYGYMGDFSAQQAPQQMAEVNFAHVMPIAQAVWNKLLQPEGDSQFVVVSSTSGQKARPNEAVYAATKYAQVGFTRSLGLESERLAAKIKVALFMPGGMQTPFWKGNEPANLSEYLDPAKVARKICDAIEQQKSNYYEETIERGSL